MTNFRWFAVQLGMGGNDVFAWNVWGVDPVFRRIRPADIFPRHFEPDAEFLAYGESRNERNVALALLLAAGVRPAAAKRRAALVCEHWRANKEEVWIVSAAQLREWANQGK